MNNQDTPVANASASNSNTVYHAEFVFDCDNLLTFCDHFGKSDIDNQTDSMLETKLEVLENRWNKLEISYKNIMISHPDTKEEAKLNFNTCFETYSMCKSHILDLLRISRNTSSHNVSSRLSLNPQNNSEDNSSMCINVPPCDAEVFKGRYEDWPSFRDMFTAIYINHKKLTPARKLYHLRNKTTDIAGAIVKRYPLCDDNFELAWNALKTRFENKRVLVDNQLKVLFNITEATSENSYSIQKIHSTVNDCLATLKSLDVKVEGWDPILIYFISTKLPNETLSLWEQSLKSHRELPKWSDMDEFLINRYEVVERISSIKLTKNRLSLPNFSQNKIQSYASQEKLVVSCKLCNEDHNLRSCPKFRKYTVQQRVDFVFHQKICNNCLSPAHLKAKCPSKNTCFICKMDHHTLLHLVKSQNSHNFIKHETHVNYPRQRKIESQENTPNNTEMPSTSNKAKNSQVQANVSFNNDYILLRTALVQIEHMGELYTIRALIDPGSQRTFISENLRNILQLPSRKSLVQIVGIGGQTQSATKECDLVIFSKRCNFKFSINAIVLPKVTKQLPSISFEIPQSSDLLNLDLADPNFNQSSQIDLILGNDSERYINIEGIKKGICGQASAYNTIFGWVLSGPITAQTVNAYTTSVIPSETPSLNETLRKFWEQEELPSTHPISSEDQYCEQFYRETTTRQSNGKYIVRLPFKREFPDAVYLGPSRILAIGQYSRMKQSLAKDGDLRKQYNAVLADYLALDHMEQTSFREVSYEGKYSSFYLPHHAVVRPEHKTTKVRVVFNASRKSKSGFSLNDVLHTGPTLQSDLTTIILNWRKYRYVFSGDIQKMYRQILIHPDDRPYQRIVFQPEINGPFKDFQLKTVTFGVNCAPFLAIRTLRQLASDSESEFPKASSILRNETYVDDILSGGYTMKETLKAQSDLIITLKSAGFPLKKITANDPQLLSDIPSEDLYDSDFLQFRESSATKTLGINWNALTDSFSYSFSPVSQTANVTKRTILSAVAKLFDPAGWITPIVIRAKMLIQKLWLEGLDWDDNVSSETLNQWINLVSDLSQVEKITIPRWLQYNPSHKIQIHGFSDASKAAYCAAVYIRCQTSEFIAFSNLLVAKSKVAPLQTISLPRLELNGAVLLANLVNYIINSLNFKESEVVLWTDSSIVLGWLSKPPWTWETYVANRISQIHRLLPNAKWRHIPTHDNPADLGTRGSKTEDLLFNPLWWHGPLWLIKPSSEWPNINPLHPPNNQIPIPQVKTFLVSSQNTTDILDHFSSYHKSLRVLCYMFRFFNKSISKIRPYESPNSLNLTQKEVSFVKTRLIILAQKAFYEEEYHSIGNSQSILNSSPLKSLNPFIDSNKVMRVNGRLSDSTLPYNERYPIILPGNSRFCQLYLSHLHMFLAHAECNQMCRMTQTEFYISRLKPRIKKIIRHCKNCIILKKKQCSQIMAPLPPDRCNLSVPFQTTGIDFAGPFELKSSTLRNAPYVKAYVSVFVCFSTKAIHLEPCSDLSTEAFCAAFARFIGRRGLPYRIMSDNGRNFLGASRKLSREFASFIKNTSTDISQKYIAHGFEWSFIPPHAPHMGGLWEAAVKSFKFHLKRIAGAHRFTFEEFATILARIEGILNSRPISAMSEDPTDLTALTPGHFLRGAPIMAFPEPNSEKLSLINRWEKLKALHHQFSIRWKEDYLKSLHKRYKWKSPMPNLKTGDLVVVMDDLLPPHEWRLGRITSTHAGSDKNVRVAEVRIATGTITRPIVKLCLLPFLNENDISQH